MDNLIIEPEVYQKIPGLIIITGIAKVENPNKDLIAEYLKTSWDKLTQEVKQHGYKTHPLISQWRDALSHAGTPVKDFPPSIEAIAKRTEKVDKPFSINPIVDTYNAISMNLALPFGAFDLDQLQGMQKLRVSAGGESFIALGSTENDPTTANEIVYADDNSIITRHFMWRQSNTGKIIDSTKNIVIVCELLDSMGADVLTKATDLIQTKFKELLNVEIQNIQILRK